MKKYITTDCKTCREINPYPVPGKPMPMCRDCADENGTCSNFNGMFCDPDLAKIQYEEFEASVKTYPLTKEMPIGEFEGKEVWQYFEDIQYKGEQHGNGWINCTENDPNLADYLNFEVRQAVEPTPSEKPLEGEEKSYKDSLSTCAIHGWNLAIEECVKVLENRLSNLYTVKYRPTFYTRFEELKVQINRLKSLKK